MPYAFPKRLPNPDNLYTPDADPVQHSHPTDLPRSAVPPVSATTYPGLFEEGSDFHPVKAISFLLMKDMLNLQALFAAGQFLAARCKEHGLVGLSEPNPFIEKHGATFACLYSELSLLGATLGTVKGEIVLGPRSRQAQCVYADFAADMRGYAPWFRFPDGAESVWKLIKEAQDKLKEAEDMITSYQGAGARWEQEKKRKAD